MLLYSWIVWELKRSGYLHLQKFLSSLHSHCNIQTKHPIFSLLLFQKTINKTKEVFPLLPLLIFLKKLNLSQVMLIWSMILLVMTSQSHILHLSLLSTLHPLSTNSILYVKILSFTWIIHWFYRFLFELNETLLLYFLDIDKPCNRILQENKSLSYSLPFGTWFGSPWLVLLSLFLSLIQYCNDAHTITKNSSFSYCQMLWTICDVCWPIEQFVEFPLHQ